VNYASSGLGTSSHLSVVMFEQAIGTRMVMLPYKSTGDVVNSMLGGNVDIAIDSMTTVWPHAKQGRCARSACRRRSAAHRRRRCRRSARPSRASKRTAWQGLFAPAGTPKPVVEKIAPKCGAFWSLPEVKEQLKNAGADSVLSESPESFTALHPRPAREVGRGGESVGRED